MRTTLTIGAVALPRPKKSLLARLLSIVEVMRASYRCLGSLMPMQSKYAALAAELVTQPGEARCSHKFNDHAARLSSKE